MNYSIKHLSFFNSLFVALILVTISSCNNDEENIFQYSEEDLIPTIELPSQIEISVVHHISRNDQGANSVTNRSTIDTMMFYLNNNFNEWGIRFTTKEVRFLDNTEWNNQFIRQDDFVDQRVLRPFEDDNSLNIFYFNRIRNRGGSTLGATALFPHQGNNVKLSRSAFAIDNTATLTHEVGHYLGLLHTSDDNTDRNGNLELVNGSNCEESGDFVCDTPASPNLNSRNINRFDFNCTYTGSETDANGDRYNPDVFNFMIQHSGAGCDAFGNSCALCRRQFTAGQVERMTRILASDFRAYLFD